MHTFTFTFCPLTFTFCPLTFTFCPLTFTFCPLTFTFCPLTFTVCPLIDVVVGWGRPDMTFAVDWALNTNFISIVGLWEGGGGGGGGRSMDIADTTCLHSGLWCSS